MDIGIGPKSGADFKHIFNDLYLGVSKMKEQRQNRLCKWQNYQCESHFENVKMLYIHRKEHIELVDTSKIAPVDFWKFFCVIKQRL